jgi:hypothetical protein
MAINYHELPFYEDDCERAQYVPKHPTYSEKTKTGYTSDSTQDTNNIHLTSNTAGEVKIAHQHKCLSGTHDIVQLTEFPNYYVVGRQRATPLPFKLIMVFAAILTTLTISNMFLDWMNADYAASSCIKCSDASDGFPMADFHGLASDLVDLQSQMSNRLTEHQDVMRGRMELINATLGSIGLSLTVGSEDLAVVRSLLANDEDGSMSCNLHCVALMARFVQTRQLDIAGESIKALLAHLEVLTQEMVNYAIFLDEVERRIVALMVTLEVPSSPTLLIPGSKNAVSSSPELLPLYGSDSIIVSGQFTSTEDLVRNGEALMEAVLIASKLNILFLQSLCISAVRNQPKNESLPRPSIHHHRASQSRIDTRPPERY